MATAKKLPSGSYRVRASFNGVRKSFTAPTKREAEFLATQWLISAEKQDTGEDMTFSEAAAIYIDQRRKTLSPTTIHLYEGYVKNTTTRLNEVRLCDITPRMVQDWVNELTVAKSPKHVHNAYGFFTAVIYYHDVDIKLKKITLPPKTKKFKRLPDAAVVMEVFRNSEIELPVLLGLWGGLRMSEILGIRKCDIEGDVLTINRVAVMVGRELVYKPHAKTYTSNRQLRLPPPILALIDALDRTAAEPLIRFNGRQIYGRFSKTMKNKGYSICFHDLRHINASVMAQLGIPDLYAMERGGWSNTSTLKSVYQQTFTTARQEVDNTIDSYFENIYSNIVDTQMDTNFSKQLKTGT